MESHDFDRLARTISDRSTRRRFGGLLLALGISTGGGLGVLGAAEAGAKRRKTKKRNRKRGRKKARNQPANQPESQPADPPCVPDCTGKICGDDGCGGSCGSCPSLMICDDGSCKAICLADCHGKICGADGCGGSCGPGCAEDEVCLKKGALCHDPDWCGQCPGGLTCDPSGQCVSEACLLECVDRDCGLTSCGMNCGDCPLLQTCVSGTCVPI